VALLHEGRLIVDAPPADAITPTYPRQVYGVDVTIREVDDAAGNRHLTCVASSRGAAATSDASMR
jgi:ABC-type hemin transport system ATPase subunit